MLTQIKAEEERPFEIFSISIMDDNIVKIWVVERPKI